jgi:hypothetical protein
MRKIPTPLTLWSSALLTAFMFSVLPGCLDTGKPCCEYLGTTTISKGLYLERYMTFCAGVFGESRTSYLTDSVSFRQVIGGNDEHGNFEWQLNGNELKTYTTESSFVSDTVEVKTISKADLLKYHHSDTACVGISPVFGKNTIQCNNHLSPDSYKTEDGNSITTVQYQCGNEYLNAVFYTDLFKFCVLVGIYKPGDPPYYGVKANTDDTYYFYRMESRTVIDTLNVQTFLLSDLKKGKLMKPCERRE